MARGWESKSVESQIEAASAKKPKARVEAKSPEELQREEELARLDFERTRVLHEIEHATHPRHRQMLEAGLRHLEARIAEIKPPIE